MAWAQEIIDFALKLKPWTTVNEYQVGLYFIFGKVREFRLPERVLKEILDERKKSGRGTQITLDEIIAQEKEAEQYYKENKEEVKQYYKQNKIYPEKYKDWHRAFLTGNMRHPERYTKNLPHGTYIHLPAALDLMRVEIVPVKEVVKDLKFISVVARKSGIRESKLIIPGFKEYNLKEPISSDDNLLSLFVSGFLRYQIEDGYCSYTQVQDWERSYHSQVLLKLSKICRKRSNDILYNSETIDSIEEELKTTMNSAGPTRKDWGIWTAEFGLTDAVVHKLVRNIQEIYVPDEGLKLIHENAE
jgi:hypothetical protein